MAEKMGYSSSARCHRPDQAGQEKSQQLCPISAVRPLLDVDSHLKVCDRSKHFFQQ
jgi:hypothetical protein